MSEGDAPARDDEPRGEGPGIEEPIREWLPRTGNPFHARLFPRGEGWRFWVDGMGSFLVDPAARRIAVPLGADPIRREERMWGIPGVLCFQERGDHSIHAAAVERDGRAIMLAAPGRFGKTTLAAAAYAAGFGLLSEDSTCVRVEGVGASIVPGPAMLRVRPDSFEHLRPPDVEVLAADDGRVHLALSPARHGDGSPVPLAAIVLLYPPADELRLDRLDATEALHLMWTLSLGLPNDEDRVRRFDRLAGLTAVVPAWGLTRPLRYDTLDDVLDALVSTCLEQADSR